MTLVDEGSLQFAFEDRWTVCKWDDSEFRARRGHIGKALDIIAVSHHEERPKALLIEIKDYPASAPPIPPKDLAATVALKVRDSLAQILFSGHSVGEAAEAEARAAVRVLGTGLAELAVILWVEDARTPATDLVELTGELGRALYWLPGTKPTTLSLATDPSPLGLSVRRQVI